MGQQLRIRSKRASRRRQIKNKKLQAKAAKVAKAAKG
jgi:hypothetical protein